MKNRQNNKPASQYIYWSDGCFYTNLTAKVRLYSVLNKKSTFLNRYFYPNRLLITFRRKSYELIIN